MVSQTNEQALEAAIEKALTGISSEALKAGEQAASQGAGYTNGSPADFDMHYAIDNRFFWEFLEKTQEKELEKVQQNNQSDWQLKILERFDRLIKKTRHTLPS